MLAVKTFIQWKKTNPDLIGWKGGFQAIIFKMPRETFLDILQYSYQIVDKDWCFAYTVAVFFDCDFKNIYFITNVFYVANGFVENSGKGVYCPKLLSNYTTLYEIYLSKCVGKGLLV